MGFDGGIGHARQGLAAGSDANKIEVPVVTAGGASHFEIAKANRDSIGRIRRSRSAI